MDFVALGSLISGFCSAVFYEFFWVLLLSLGRGPLFTPSNIVFFSVVLLTVVGIVWQNFYRVSSEAWVHFATRMAFAFAVLGPLVPLTALYLASWRASVVLGHWPQIWADDPSNCCGDALGSILYQGFHYVCAFGSWCVISFAALLLHLRTRVPAARLIVMMGVFLLAWTLFGIEPGGRLIWWLD